MNRELRDDDARFRLTRFFTHWRDEDFAGASAVADTVLSKDIEHVSLILCYFAELQLDRGHYDGAMSSLQRLQQNMHCAGARPLFYAPSYYLMGRTLESRGDVSGAARHYEKFLGLWSNGDDDLALLGEARLCLASLKSYPQQTH